MARRKKGLLIELMKIAKRLPWWASLSLAGFAYLVFHQLAVIEVQPTGKIKDLSSVIVMQVLKVLGVMGQFIVPAVFLIGALVSGYRQVNRTPKSLSDLFSDLPESSELPQASSVSSVEDHYFIRAEPTIAARRPTQWSLELLRAIDWKRFEEVCAEYFRLCGFHATTQSHGPDGGIDVKLYAPKDRSRLVNIVQCKQWSKPIGPKALRELLGVMTASKLSRGIFVASSTFNDEAIRFATENHIHLLDGQRFLRKILERPSADQARLLKVATEGDYLTPSCPSCGIKLLKRERKKDKGMFWGCANFPRCRYILNA